PRAACATRCACATGRRSCGRWRPSRSTAGRATATTRRRCPASSSGAAARAARSTPSPARRRRSRAPAKRRARVGRRRCGGCVCCRSIDLRRCGPCSDVPFLSRKELRVSRKIAACLGLWLVATAALAAERVTGDAAANVVKKYRGDWGCFFEAPQSQFGPIRGLELITIDRAGNVAGEESVVYNDPFIAAQTTFGGQLAAQDNGTLAGVLVLHVVSPPGIPDVPFDIICEGVS